MEQNYVNVTLCIHSVMRLHHIAYMYIDIHEKGFAVLAALKEGLIDRIQTQK